MLPPWVSMLGLTALAFGTLIHWLPVPGRGLAAVGGPPTEFTGGEPLSPSGHLDASDFSRIVKDELAPFYRVFDSDRLWLWLWHRLGQVSSRIAEFLQIFERCDATRAHWRKLGATGGWMVAHGPCGPNPIRGPRHARRRCTVCGACRAPDRGRRATLVLALGFPRDPTMRRNRVGTGRFGTQHYRDLSRCRLG